MSKTGTRASNGATALDRAKIHSQPDGDCWIWQGYLHGSSGVPFMNGSYNAPQPLQPALLEEVSGGRPKWAKATTTTCGNRACVNPEHLKWETQDEYRLRCRRSQSVSKMTLEQVNEAWRRKQAGESATALAAEYGISRIGLYRQWDRWVDRSKSG